MIQSVQSAIMPEEKNENVTKKKKKVSGIKISLDLQNPKSDVSRI